MIKIPQEITDVKDFWKYNSQLGLITIFKRLREKYGDDDAARYLITLFLFLHPDEEKNILYRYSQEERKDYISKNYFKKIDWDCPLFNEAMDDYPYHCQTAIERALNEELTSLKSRARFLRDTEYSLESGSKLDTMRSKTKGIYEQLEDTIKKFTESQKEEGRVFGGRNLSASERGFL